MENEIIIISSILSSIFTGLFLYFYIPLIKNKILDYPNHRSSHINPIPTSGGISFVIIGSISSILMGNYVSIIFFPLVIVGFIDDVIGLSALTRFLTQVSTSIFLILYSNSNLFNIDISISGFIVSIILIFGSTSIINFVNFMDGLDGLLAGCFSIIIFTSSFLFYPSLFPFFSAVLVFLSFNWSPAKIFMGDSGSTFLGALYVYILINSPSIAALAGLITISAPLLIDAIYTLILRLKFRQPLFSSHRSHLYQRLNQSGFSHAMVSLIYIISTFIISVSFVLGGYLIAFIIAFSYIFIAI